MLTVSGPARIIQGPNFYDGTVNKFGADLEVEFSKGKTMQLISPNLIMTEMLSSLQTGQNVHFEGWLDENEPGYYVIKLTSIRRIKNR